MLFNVTKEFADPTDFAAEPIHAVDHVTLTIQDGEVFAIVGPSGCGKTTLLKIIAGLEDAESGTIHYGEVELQDIPLRERNIGMVFQDYALVPHWESRQTIGFFFWLRDREQEVPQRLREISEITGIGLKKLLYKKPRQLSGGEQQRVAIARALSRDLRVLIFDEPFANLDAKLRQQARGELKKLLRRYPVTTVYVTHDQVEAMALSDRIAVMNEGHIEQVASYNHLYSAPLNTFVAGFIGTPPMNLFEGTVTGDRWSGYGFKEVPFHLDVADGSQVTMGIRAEHMYLTAEGTPGVVEGFQRYLPERMQMLHLKLGDERWFVKAPLDDVFEIGDTVYCDIDPQGLHFFFTLTGHRIGQ